MRADTQAVSIEAAPEALLAFLADAENLPRWAVGFAKAVRRAGAGWVVTTHGGEMGLQIETHTPAGTLDFLLTPHPGLDVRAASRVIPRGRGSEYVFTQFQAPGATDEEFAASIATLRHELAVLKAIMEVACPL